MSNKFRLFYSKENEILIFNLNNKQENTTIFIINNE